MECGVEARHGGDAGQQPVDHVHRVQGHLLVQWGQRCQLGERPADPVVDEDRSLEPFASVHHPVAGRVDRRPAAVVDGAHVGQRPGRLLLTGAAVRRLQVDGARQVAGPGQDAELSC